MILRKEDSFMNETNSAVFSARIELVKIIKESNSGELQFKAKLLKIDDPSMGNSKKEIDMCGYLPSLDLGKWFEVKGSWIASTHSSIFSIQQAKESPPIRIYFEVKKILTYKKDTGWAKIEVNLKEYGARYMPATKIYVIGFFPSIFEGDEFSAEGYWDRHQLYGYAFKLSTPPYRQFPQSTKGIIEVLKRIKGVGKKQASAIAEKFGTQTFSIIETDWKALKLIPRMTENRAREIQKEIVRYREFSNLSVYLMSAGIDPRKTLTIYDAFGAASVSIVRKDPYSICTLPGIDFQDADAIAYKEGISFFDKKRIEEGTLFYLTMDSLTNGNLYTKEPDMVEELFHFLWKKTVYHKEKTMPPLKKEVIAQTISSLEQQGRIVIEVDDNHQRCIYHGSYYGIESNIIQRLTNLMNAGVPPFATPNEVDTFLRDYQKHSAMPLAKKQEEAIHMALENPMCIVTGGPGTGKTKTINDTIQAIKYFKPNAIIHLCAPTGKAAKRMTELTGMPAKTIHRLINLVEFWKRQVLTKLEGDYLIVDESSMIDAYVFSKLLESISSTMKIVFVGDVEQLPSTGAGLILRDLIDSKRIPTTVLTEIFRQAKESQIVMNSHKLIQGKTTEDIDGLTFDHSKNDFFFLETEDIYMVKRKIEASIHRLLEKGDYTLRDIQVIAPMKEGDLGIYALNKMIQEIFNPHVDGQEEMDLSFSHRKSKNGKRFDVFRHHDRVIQLVNNYDLGVFNGEVGEVVNIYYDEDDNHLMEVDFDDKTIVYSEGIAKDELTLAYAITTHKSQGSEFPVVIMPIHHSQKSMLERHLLYTTWTRAKKMLVAIGSIQALNEGARRNETIHRNSRIKEKLMERLPLLVTS